MEAPRNGSEEPPRGNASSSASAPSLQEPYSAAGAALLGAAVALLIVGTVVGNALVVVAVLSSRALRAPQNLFLVSLACADILVAALVMPFSLANELMGWWAFGRAWCAVYLALDVLFCTASIVQLCAISLDRYWAVTRAVEYAQKRTPRRVKAVVLLVWLLAALISVPPLGSLPREPPEGRGRPQCRLNDQTWYILCSCAASFFVPCLIMLLVYARIYRVALLRTRTLSQKRAASRRVHNGPGAENGPGGAASLNSPEEEDGRGSSGRQRHWRAASPEDVELEDSSASEGRRRRSPEEDARGRAGRGPPSSSKRSLPGEFFASHRRRRAGSLGPDKAACQAREKRFTFVLAVVMGVFVLCWSPFFFSYSLYGICRQACQTPETLFKFFFWIGYCNSSLNPIIYTIFNQDFRRAFKHILFGGRKKKKNKRVFFLH